MQPYCCAFSNTNYAYVNEAQQNMSFLERKNVFVQHTRPRKKNFQIIFGRLAVEKQDLENERQKVFLKCRKACCLQTFLNGEVS